MSTLRRTDQASNPPHLHEAFLERASAGEEAAGGYALGAFLTLRLVDHFAHGVAAPVHDALAYQISSTRDYLLGLPPAPDELGHLLEIVRVAEVVHGSGRRHALWPPLLAFAQWLEHQTHLREALDVLDTALRLGDGAPGRKELEAHLRRGHVLCRARRYQEATAAFTTAEGVARDLGDHHAVLLGRVGRGRVLQQSGRLDEAEALLRSVAADAVERSDHEAEARASQQLAGVLSSTARAADAVPWAYRAYELYGSADDRLRALFDLGSTFKALRHYEPAADAFELILRGSPPRMLRLASLLELVDLSARTADRLGFERWRRELDRDVDLPSEVEADFEVRQGIGLAAFGQRARAEEALRRAVVIARQFRMEQHRSRAEEALRALDDRPATRHESVAADGPGTLDGVVAHVADQVRALRATAE